MIDLKTRLRACLDKLIAGLLVLLLFGTSLAFGGSTWWARAFVAAAASLAAVSLLVRILFEGKWTIARDPLPILAWLTIGATVVQLIPFPGAIAERLSPRSRELYSIGVFADLARLDDPNATLPEPVAGRSPTAIDRPATIRALGFGVVCLILFLVSGRFADRLSRLLTIWGCVVAACALHAVFGLVQVVGDSRALYGLFEPGKGPSWTPSLLDVSAVPHSSALRSLRGGSTVWALPKVDRGFPLGGLLDGAGAFRASAVLALPLALAILIQLLAPRGSRLRLRDRIRESGQGGLIVALSLATGAIAVFLGLISGLRLCAPAATGLLAAGALGGWRSGFRRGSIALTLALFAAIAAGWFLGESLGRPPGIDPLEGRDDWNQVVSVWKQTARVARDFPLLGVGLGGLPTILPYGKTVDRVPTTALSGFWQWSAEMGLAGTVPLALAAIWCLARLPRSFRRVGPADRPLAGGLLGAVVAFSLHSLIQTGFESPSIALGAAAVFGTFDRWIAGGTDLFVQG